MADCRCLGTALRYPAGAERTIELNPEDLTRERLAGIREMGFNRLSVGVQSFSDDHLKQINRTHTGAQAMEGVRLAADMGFDNISVDLIIGLPGQTEKDLLDDIAVVNRLPVKHLSVYMLSIDSNTVFEVMVRQGKFKLEDEEVIARRYDMVCKLLEKYGFRAITRYRISHGRGNTRFTILRIGNKSLISGSDRRLTRMICIPGSGIRQI